MNWFIVFKNNFKRGLHKKTSFFVKLLLPTVVVMLGIAANYADNPAANIGIVYSGENVSAEAFMQALNDTPGIEARLANPDMISTDVILGKYTAVVKFAEDSFTLYSVKDENTHSNLEQLTESYIKDQTPVKADFLQAHNLSTAQRTTAFILLFLMITATITAALMIKDKNNGTFIRFLHSPQNAVTYVLGNITYNFAITYFQFFVSVSALELTGINVGIDYLNLLVMGIWIVALATAFGTCMASLFNNEMYSNLFSTCIVLILSLIGGTFIPFPKMPAGLQYISVISPWRWFISIVTSMEQGSDWFSNLPLVLILTLFIVAFSLVAFVKNKNFRSL